MIGNQFLGIRKQLSTWGVLKALSAGHCNTGCELGPQSIHTRLSHHNSLGKHLEMSRAVPCDKEGFLKVGNLSWETTSEALCCLSVTGAFWGTINSCCWMNCFNIFPIPIGSTKSCVPWGEEVQLSCGVHHLYLAIRGVDKLLNSIIHLISETLRRTLSFQGSLL